MKTIEEKAKAYDDLLVKLQKAKVDNNVCDERYCCVIDDIVPELKESDEERIRKVILKALMADEAVNILVESGIYYEDVESWLEKQSKASKVEAAMREIEKKSKLFTEAHKGETSEEILALMKGEKGVVLRDTFGYEEGREKGREEGVMLVLDNPRKYGFEKGLRNLANSAKTCKDGQEPTDKVEPKFHEGDWVTIKE